MEVVGEFVGLELGDPVGIKVGDLLGPELTGDPVGTKVGEAVGTETLGDLLGETVGIPVDTLGETVGAETPGPAVVGIPVCCRYSHSYSSSSSSFKHNKACFSPQETVRFPSSTFDKRTMPILFSFCLSHEETLNQEV